MNKLQRLFLIITTCLVFLWGICIIEHNPVYAYEASVREFSTGNVSSFLYIAPNGYEITHVKVTVTCNGGKIYRSEGALSVISAKQGEYSYTPGDGWWVDPIYNFPIPPCQNRGSITFYLDASHASIAQKNMFFSVPRYSEAVFFESNSFSASGSGVTSISIGLSPMDYASQYSELTYNNTQQIINNPTYGLNALNTKLTNLDTKTNTINTKISDVDTKINNINTQIANLNNKIESSSPVITKVSTATGATASTTGQSPPIVVSASNADMFDLNVNGSNWIGAYAINSPGYIGISSGVNNIRVRAYDSSAPLEKRKYGYGDILIFGI